jgi:hypothetical protein
LIKNRSIPANTNPAAHLSLPPTTYPQTHPQQLWASRILPVEKLKKTVTYLEVHAWNAIGCFLIVSLQAL